MSLHRFKQIALVLLVAAGVSLWAADARSADQIPSAEVTQPWELDSYQACDNAGVCKAPGLFDELYLRFAFDGSKQPQDFGVNAVAGAQATINLGLPVLPDYGIGFQIGSSITATSNAVRVYELVGETTGRTQSFTTVGMFQRFDSGWSWGVVHDFLYEDYFDDFSLGQWRLRSSFDFNECNQVGATAMLRSYDDTGTFGASTDVRLQPIDQLQFYWRHYWQSGAQTSLWLGLADGHGEDNAVTGFAPAKDESFLFGADVLMPLTPSLAIYGETNIITPIDTGTVDAFLGIQWYPGAKAYSARRGKFSPMFEVASPVSLAADLIRL
ncbi:DUF6666 family protein [Rhodopirellula sp. MGV]|uniref:DUF6666 family protein n=1 Tax=Rhodopirellula sp. MGV TaxID=2023130 RepID=UPI00117A9B0A|nr:DUF6666 family protein [Rhodopirellula sp. MGV]